ncbi:MAG: MerR family transcriptional regulator [Oscillospiraceae bacterium]|nr:MerR family transcriptional regulator [Oscillospiraceae bacterium]
MKYKIGDVSKILGISADLLRYYEKKGVVMPMKGKYNDYRYYDFWDINFLMDCLWFKNFGFSIDQVADIVKFYSTEQLDDLFQTKEDELEATIARCQLLLQRAKEYRDDLKKAHELLGVCDIVESPEYVRYLNRYTDTFDNSPELQKLSHEWLNLLPFTQRCFEIEQDCLMSDEGMDYAWGLSLNMEYVNLLHVSLEPPVLHIPKHRCLRSVFKSSGKGNFSPQLIRYMVDYCQANGLIICGPARGSLLCSVSEGDALTGFFEVWLPIK